MTHKKLLMVAGLLLLSLGVVVADADFNNSPQTMTITGVVGQVQRIVLPGNQTFNLTGNAADGSVSLGTMSIFSNVSYTVTVSSTNTFQLTSSTTSESISYDLSVGSNAVNEGTGAAIPSTPRTTGGGDDYALELTYVQSDADELGEANDYTDTLSFTIASP